MYLESFGDLDLGHTIRIVTGTSKSKVECRCQFDSVSSSKDLQNRDRLLSFIPIASLYWLNDKQKVAFEWDRLYSILCQR